MTTVTNTRRLSHLQRQLPQVYYKSITNKSYHVLPDYDPSCHDSVDEPVCRRQAHSHPPVPHVSQHVLQDLQPVHAALSRVSRRVVQTETAQVQREMQEKAQSL